MENMREKYNLDLPRAKGAYLEDAPDHIWTNPDYVLEPKLDGTRESLQIGGMGSLLVGRNRQGFLKGVNAAGAFQIHQHPIFSQIACLDLEGTLLDGELTMGFTQDGEYDELTKIRQREGIFIGYTVWQAIFYKGEDLRTLSDDYRRKAAEWTIQRLNNPYIRLIERYPATRENLETIWNSGGEGAIAKLSTAKMKIGQRTQPDWYKLKTQDTVDAFITGVTQGKSGGSGVNGVKAQNNGCAASFTVSMYGSSFYGITRDLSIIPVGKIKNLPEEVMRDGFANFDKYENRVVEMRVSGWNGKSFRWARFMKFRDDKTPTDCRFSEQIGYKK